MAKTVGFADDIAVVVVRKLIWEVTLSANEAVVSMGHWFSVAGLELADQKTEAVLVTSRKVREEVTLALGNCPIQSKPSLRYKSTPYFDSTSTPRYRARRQHV